ncbi:MAG: exosortase/archaeosortase family protein [Planctomycetaceae bacterium]|nr:exosortase/archaeosortase family protein [Planctomycetaceae bacterium]
MSEKTSESATPSPQPVTTEQSSSIPRPVLIGAGLLGVAHLPFVLKQFAVLWQLEYYQFFPFAFIAFGMMLRGRRLPGEIRLDRWTAILAGMDLTLLTWGSFAGSRWCVYAGFIIFCFNVARSCLDAEYETSLGYLGLLLAITIRLPVGMDGKLIQELQTLTTKVGSRILEFFGYLHFREGNVLEFPGKRFLVEEACSGVQSFFAVMFLAALIICGYRRRWLHSLLVLVSAAGFAGVMNVARICAISVAWADFDYDLSTGWRHDTLGYITLGLAGFLVFSADAFWEMFFGKVPDTRGTGISQLFRNPFIIAWNNFFHLKTRKTQPDVSLPAAAWLPRAAIMFGGLSLVALGLQIRIVYASLS